MKNKTQKNNKSVDKYLNTISDKQKRYDCFEIKKMMEDIAKEKGYMWGDSIIGFGTYKYSRSDKSEHEFLILGFAPRQKNISIYAMPGLQDQEDLMKDLGKHKSGVGCIYVNKLSDIDKGILKKILKRSFKNIKDNYETY